MTERTFDRKASPAPGNKPSPTPAQARHDYSNQLITPDTVTLYQRLVGNRAVARMVQQRSGQQRIDRAYQEVHLRSADAKSGPVEWFWSHRESTGDNGHTPPHNYAYQYGSPNTYAKSDAGGHAEREVYSKFLLARGAVQDLRIMSEMEPCPPCAEYFKRLDREPKSVPLDVTVYYMLKYDQSKLGSKLDKLYTYFHKLAPFRGESVPTKEEIEGL